MKISKRVIQFFIITLIFSFLAIFVFPTKVYCAYGENDINISSNGAIVIDFETGAVLYEKNADAKIYPASTTKVLTAILAIENGNLDDKITISQNALKGQANNGTHVGLKAGEKITLKDAVYSMMLESANDSAIAIAEHIGGSEEKFADMLNEKAKSIGSTNSHFVTPNGLFNENHYTTPRDMALITQYAMKNDTFMKLFQTHKYNLEPTNKRGEALDIYTTHKMSPGKSHAYEYFLGGKTGYLNESKCNLVTAAQKDDRTLIAFVAGNNSPYDICVDTKNLFDKSFADFKNISLSKDKNDASIEALINDGGYKIKNSQVSSDSLEITLPNDASEKDVTFKVVEKDLSFPIDKGDKTGEIQAIYNNEIVGKSDILAKKDMTTFKFVFALIIKLIIGIVLFLVILILSLRIYFTKIRPKIKKHNKKRAYK